VIAENDRIESIPTELGQTKARLGAEFSGRKASLKQHGRTQTLPALTYLHMNVQ